MSISLELIILFITAIAVLGTMVTLIINTLSMNKRIDDVISVTNTRFDAANARFDKYYEILMSHDKSICLIDQALAEIREHIKASQGEK